MEKEKKIVGLGFYPKKEKNIGQWLSKRNSKLAVLQNEYILASDKRKESEAKLNNLYSELKAAKYNPSSRPIEEIEYDISREEKNLVTLKIDEEEKKEKFISLRDNDEKYNKYKKYGLYEGGTIGFEFQNEDEHIIESVKRILSTRRGERVGNLAFGSDVSKYLFMPDMSIDDVIQEISNSITRNDNRIEVIECTLKAVEWDTVEINLKVRVKRTNKILEISTNVNQGE